MQIISTDKIHSPLPEMIKHGETGSGRVEEIYMSDEFRMYAYKIKRCPRTRSHDWTECPYAHRGEKAQRRDPRRVRYCAIACPAFRNGSCPKGDECEYAHGVFEYWLHPARYRTRACNAGKYCQRKVCFFAHSPEQLRPETKYRCRYAYRPAPPRALDCSSDTPAAPVMTMDSEKNEKAAIPGEEEEEDGDDNDDVNDDGVSHSLMQLSLSGRESNSELDHIKGNVGLEALSWDSELHHLGWISELVE